MAKPVTVPQTVYLPLDVNAVLARVAYEFGMSKSALIATAVSQYLEQREQFKSLETRATQ